jgi:hypothetical protein
MSSHEPSESAALDLGRDVPTTATDVEVLRRLRREAPPWFSFTAAELDALIPEGALDRRPVMRADAVPFTLSENPRDMPGRDSTTEEHPPDPEVA